MNIKEDAFETIQEKGFVQRLYKGFKKEKIKDKGQKVGKERGKEKTDQSVTDISVSHIILYNI